ncbi:MAG: DUF2225 domain-containing protein [Oculatellaceae cyanobacterium bins.114]|nr:DUF2225 domain-containing protein [Oculatellaceae cyanobacterium bins.114]
MTYYHRALAIYGGRIISPIDRTAQLYEASKIANTIASIYLTLGQTEQAIETYQQALAIDRRTTPGWTEASTLSNLGTTYRIAGQLEPALATYQQAASIYTETSSNPYEAVKLFNQLGMLYQEQGQFELALTVYQQGLAMVAEQSEEFQSVDRILTLENISRLYQAQGQTEQATHYAEQATTALTQASVDSYGIESPFRGADLLQKIGRFYLVNSQLERAASYFDRAMAIASQHTTGNPDVILNGILVEYTRHGQVAPAIPYQQRYIAMLQDRGLSANTASSLRRLATMYQTVGQLDLALSTYQQALTNYQDSDREYGGQTDEIAQTLLGIGAIYEAQEKPEQALTAYQQALTLYQTEQTEDSLQHIHVLDALAKFYNTQGQGDQAEPYAQQAQTLRDRLLH